MEEFDQCVESLISGAVDVVNSVLPADTEFGCHQCTSVLAQGTPTPLKNTVEKSTKVGPKVQHCFQSFHYCM